DRNLLAGRAGRPPPRAVLRGGAVLDDRSHDRVGRGDPDRGARRVGSPPGRRTADRAERVAGVQPGLRRHAGPAHHGDRHRARRHASAVSLLTAREYHDRTAHSPASVRTSGHTLEWDIKPFPFKVYTDLAALALPRELDPLAADDSIRRRSATIVLTAIYWRNTWKYQARAYRHLFWDSGTMLANVLAVGGALGLAPRVLTGFADDAVNRLLGLDTAREVALELVVIGPETVDAPVATPLDTIDHATLPLSSSEVDYPLIHEVQAASRLDTAAAVRAWRSHASSSTPPTPLPSAKLVVLPPPRTRAGRGLGETIQRRGSTRQFGHAPLSAEELGTALWAAARPFEADAPPGLVDLYLIVNAVEGISPGAYFYRPAAHALETLAVGDFRNRSAYLCLEQPLGGDAAVILYWITRLDDLTRAFGDRGYRLA